MLILPGLEARLSLARACVRYFAMDARRGLVLGVFTESHDNNQCDADQKNAPIIADQFTSNAGKFNTETSGLLLKHLNCSEPLKIGKHRIFYGLSEKYSAVAVAGLGKKSAEVDNQEQWHVGRENVRNATAVAARALRDVGCRTIDVDPCGYANAAAEGATLSLFSYDELKSQQDCRKPSVNVNLYSPSDDPSAEDLFHKGVIAAEGQNLARKLMEMPANLLSPMRFAQLAQDMCSNLPNVEVTPRDKAWAEQEKMFAFLSVAQGSEQPPVFLEVKLASKSNLRKPPVVLVGKGVCFDSGGISLKPPAKMDAMRADMGGAANVLAAIYTLGRLNVNLPFDVVGLMPLVENMPSGKATKPGDVFFAKNGKSIKVDNTDAEGRLILADALCYADSFKPSHVIDIATLTGAMFVSLGGVATGVFCSDDELWNKILAAGVDSGERVWRLPLFKAYGSKIKADMCDLVNIAKPNAGAGSCVAAGFLKEFVECKSWAHMDIAGVMEADGDMSYIPKGMSGRPLRLLINLINSMAQ